MKIAIDRNVPIPAYQQVVDGVAAAIAEGDVGHGTRLPSVRNLAVELGLNVNTVARAYRDLERSGVITTMPGMGTFVAQDVPPRSSWPITGSGRRGHAPPRSLPATGAGAEAPAAGAPISHSWRELLSAACALSAADGLSEEEFLVEAGNTVRTGGARASLLVVASRAGEAADMLRSLPTDMAAAAVAVEPAQLATRARSGGVTAVLTTFPGQSEVRSQLAELADRVGVVPVETELSEATLRALTGLPASARIALVTIEKDNWDHEANDVMKILGRSRWLKMVLLESGERNLVERLAGVDAVLFVPRARDVVESLDSGSKTLVELGRQVTSRTRERLRQALGSDR